MNGKNLSPMNMIRDLSKCARAMLGVNPSGIGMLESIKA
jgi:hypothetical protein